MPNKSTCVYDEKKAINVTTTQDTWYTTHMYMSYRSNPIDRWFKSWICFHFSLIRLFLTLSTFNVHRINCITFGLNITPEPYYTAACIVFNAHSGRSDACRLEQHCGMHNNRIKKYAMSIHLNKSEIRICSGTKNMIPCLF